LSRVFSLDLFLIASSIINAKSVKSLRRRSHRVDPIAVQRTICEPPSGVLIGWRLYCFPREWPVRRLLRYICDPRILNTLRSDWIATTTPDF
jgi:hypothetical protein